MKTLNCAVDEEKIQITQEAIKNYFTLQGLPFVEDKIEGETGWGWIVVVGEGKRKDGQLKHHLTTVTISKLSDTLLQVSYGRNVKLSKIVTTIGASAGWFVISPLGPLVTLGIIGGFIASVTLTNKSRKIEKTISDILELHLDINEKGKQNEKA